MELVTGFILKHIKGLAEIAAVLAVVVGIHVWLANRDQANFDRGVKSVEAQLKDAQSRADSAERSREQAFQLTSDTIDKKTEAAATQLTVKLDPLNKALANAISSDPNAHCTQSDGLRGALEAQRSAVNASIAAGNAGQPR